MFVTQRFIKVNAPSPESQWSCICVLGMLIFFIFYDFDI